MSPHDDDDNYTPAYFNIDKLLNSLPEPTKSAKEYLAELAAGPSFNWSDLTKGPMQNLGFENPGHAMGSWAYNPAEFNFKDLVTPVTFPLKSQIVDILSDISEYGSAGIAKMFNSGLIDTSFPKPDLSMPLPPVIDMNPKFTWIDQLQPSGFAETVADYINTTDWSEMVASPAMFHTFPKYELPKVDLSENLAEVYGIGWWVRNMSDFQREDFGFPEDMVLGLDKALGFYDVGDFNAAAQIAAAVPGLSESIESYLEDYPEVAEKLVVKVTGKSPVQLKELTPSQLMTLVGDSFGVITTAGVTVLTASTFPIMGLLLFIACVAYVWKIETLNLQVLESREKE